MLPFPAVPSNIHVKHGDEVILLGSCFADSMMEHFQNNGFSVTSNPFGTIFHPLALADAVEASISVKTVVDLHQRDDLYFSWDASSKIYGTSNEELEQNVVNARKKFRERIVSAKVLVITFGTSWGYIHTSLNKVVANCHKERKEVFSKKLAAVDAMFSRWKEIIGLRFVNCCVGWSQQKNGKTYTDSYMKIWTKVLSFQTRRNGRQELL